MRLQFGCIQKMCKTKQWTRYHRVSCALHLMFVSVYCFNSLGSCMQRDHANYTTSHGLFSFLVFMFCFPFYESFSVCSGLHGQFEFARKKKKRIVHVRDRVDVVTNTLFELGESERSAHRMTCLVPQNTPRPISNNRQNADNIRMVN